MRRFAGLVVLLLPAAAAAAPPCAPSSGEPRIATADDTITVCFGTQADCIQLGKTEKDRKTVATPAPVTPATEIRDDGGKLSVCAGATCKPVGKKLAAEIDKAKKIVAASPPDETIGPPITFAATTDLALVTMKIYAEGIDRVQLWSVAKDTRLTPKPPVEYKKTGETGEMMGLEAIGPTLVVEWSACAGPCSEGVIVDASGATRGAWFPFGDGVALDDKRIAIVPDGATGKLTVLERRTGKHLGELPLGDGMTAILRAAVAKLPGADFAALYDDGQAIKVSRVSAPAGKPPAIVWTQAIDTCPN